MSTLEQIMLIVVLRGLNVKKDRGADADFLENQERLKVDPKLQEIYDTISKTIQTAEESALHRRLPPIRYTDGGRSLY